MIERNIPKKCLKICYILKHFSGTFSSFFSHQILVVLAKQQQRWWGIEMVEAPPFPNWYKNPPTGPNSLSVDPERSFSSAHLCKHEGLCKYITYILYFVVFTWNRRVQYAILSTSVSRKNALYVDHQLDEVLKWFSNSI